MKRSRRNKCTHTRRGARARLLARKILNVILTDDVVSLLLLYTIYTFILSEVWRECERAREWTYSFHISHFALFWPCMTTHFYIVAVSFCFFLSLSLTHARSLSLASILWVFCVTPKLSKNVHHTHTTHLLILLLQNEYKFTLWIELLFICMFCAVGTSESGIGNENERASEWESHNHFIHGNLLLILWCYGRRNEQWADWLRGKSSSSSGEKTKRELGRSSFLFF